MPKGALVPRKEMKCASKYFLIYISPLTSHNTCTLKSCLEWPFSLKCLATWVSLPWYMSDRCSLNLVANVRPVSPMYREGHLVHLITYTRFVIVQENDFLMIKEVPLPLTVCCVSRKGQQGQSDTLHGLVPMGVWALMFLSLECTTWSRIFTGRL